MYRVVYTLQIVTCAMHSCRRRQHTQVLAAAKRPPFRKVYTREQCSRWSETAATAQQVLPRQTCRPADPARCGRCGAGMALHHLLAALRPGISAQL